MVQYDWLNKQYGADSYSDTIVAVVVKTVSLWSDTKTGDKVPPGSDANGLGSIYSYNEYHTYKNF